MYEGYFATATTAAVTALEPVLGDQAGNAAPFGKIFLGFFGKIQTPKQCIALHHQSYIQNRYK